MYAGRLLAVRRSSSIRQPRKTLPSQEASRRPVFSEPKRYLKVQSKACKREKKNVWSNLQRFLCQQRVIGVLNIIVLISLSWNTIMLILGLVTAHESRIPSLSYSVHTYLTAFATPPPHPTLGYGSVRQATFRDKYPSTTLSHSGTFDAVYVISNPRCDQWKEFKRRAQMADLSVKNFPMLDWRTATLESPPVPLSQRVRETLNPQKRTGIKTLKRQLVYLDAHRRVWESVANKSSQRVLVVDEALFPSKRLLASLPPMMTNIDTESIAKQKAWHVVQFRLLRAWPHKRDPWCMNPVYHHAVVRANASLGAGIYALSLHGARYLLEHVNEYRAPIDVEFALLQVEDDEFVALSGCNNDHVKPFCPEMVDVLQSQDSMECLWHRFWETRSVDVFKKLVRP